MANVEVFNCGIFFFRYLIIFTFKILGDTYTGLTQCAAGLACYEQDKWYSQCLTSCPPNWQCYSEPGGSTTESPTTNSGSTEAIKKYFNS